MFEDWINVEKELPPFDGDYLICNDPEMILKDHTNAQIGIAYYDGFGFIYCNVYRPALYWRMYKKPEKRYGKIIEND